MTALQPPSESSSPSPSPSLKRTPVLMVVDHARDAMPAPAPLQPPSIAIQVDNDDDNNNNNNNNNNNMPSIIVVSDPTQIAGDSNVFLTQRGGKMWVPF